MAGGAAMKSGLRKEDRVVKINNKLPKTIEEVIDVLKKSKVRRDVK